MKPTDELKTLAETTAYELDWEVVEPASEARMRDALGLTPEDRRALGMTAPRTLDLAPTLSGDASEALRDAIVRGASFAKK